MAVADLLGGAHYAEEESHEHKAAEPHKEHDPAAYEHLKDAIGAMSHGALHRELGVDVNSVIPHDRLESAAHSSNHLLARRARFAITMEHWKKGRKGPHDAEFHHDEEEK